MKLRQNYFLRLCQEVANAYHPFCPNARRRRLALSTNATRDQRATGGTQRE